MSGERPATWTNWAGQQRCAPQRIERPQDEAALVDAVVRAVRAGLRVRVAGSGHSFTDACCTDDVLIDQSRMGRVLEIDRESRLVRVQAGIKIHRLAEELAAAGLALENQGDIDAQSLAGALSTGTHGTGLRFPNMAAGVAACRLVTAAGEVLELSEQTDSEALLAARVSIGALGAISEYTLRVVPAFRIHRIDAPRPLTEVLATLDQAVEASDHLEVFALPYCERCLLLTSTRTDRPAETPSPWRARWDDVLTNDVLELALRVGRRFPATIPSLSRLFASLVSYEEHLNHSHRVYANDRRVRFTEMEYAIPRAHAREAVERTIALVRRRRLPVLFPLELRFVAGDDALLSPAEGRETAYIAIHQYVGMEYESFFRGVERIMDGYGGRPHWGKRHYQTHQTLASRYPGWDRFQAVRARLDPDGIFTNDYIDRVLGPVRAAQPVRVSDAA